MQLVRRSPGTTARSRTVPSLPVHFLVLELASVHCCLLIEARLHSLVAITVSNTRHRPLYTASLQELSFLVTCCCLLLGNSCGTRIARLCADWQALKTLLSTSALECCSYLRLKARPSAMESFCSHHSRLSHQSATSSAQESSNRDKLHLSVARSDRWTLKCGVVF